MIAGRVFYRFRQFINATLARPDADMLHQVNRFLTPAQFELFKQMQPGEQVHSFLIAERLRLQGDAPQDLIAAALLHDVGKSCYPLGLWDRALVVLAKALLPGWVDRWSEGVPKGWRRPFVVSRRHAEWGAEMVALAGGSPLTVALIRRHHSAPPCGEGAQSPGECSVGDQMEGSEPFLECFSEDRLLGRLQSLDQEN